MAQGDEDGSGGGDVLRFPQSRVPLSGKSRPFKELGVSPFAERFGSPDRRATGHWCSRCRGIWYGYLLEVTCPVCGNRHGGGTVSLPFANGPLPL